MCAPDHCSATALVGDMGEEFSPPCKRASIRLITGPRPVDSPRRSLQNILLFQKTLQCFQKRRHGYQYPFIAYNTLQSPFITKRCTKSDTYNYFSHKIGGDPYGSKKSIQFLLRTDEHDGNEIRKKVAASGLSQQDYLLKAALEAPIINFPIFRELLTEYKRQGNNLNQLTKAVNSGFSMSPELMRVINDVTEERNDIWQLLKQSIQKQA